MPSLISKVEIANQTLDYLKEAPLSSFTEGTKRSDWFRRNYDTQRKTTLLIPNIPWGFANKYWDIPMEPDEPAGPWAYAFKRPTDMLRMYPLRESGLRDSPRVEYEIAGNLILTDYNANPLIVRGRRNASNEGEFSDQFVEVFTLRMAIKAAHFITGKASLREELREDLRTALDSARMIENTEQVYTQPKQDTRMIKAQRRFTARTSYSGGRGY